MTTATTPAVALTLAAVAIGAATAWRRAHRRIAELERSSNDFRGALLRLGQALGATDDRSALVGVVLDAACTMVAADAAVFWRDFGAFLVARAEQGAPDSLDRRLAPGEGLSGWVAEHRDPARWPPAAVHPAAAEPAATSALAVPLVAAGRLYGVLALYRTRPDAEFGESDVTDAAEIARQAGAAIDASFLHEEARRLSLTDGLTGLWNRRQFELRVTQELERATRFGEEFSIVMVDLDDFKRVNDTFGHGTGDAVLIETANRLMSHTREVDLVARLGGEEFVMVLPHTDCAGAVLAAEKVRAELAAEPVTTEAGPVSITLSAGVACHPYNGSGPATLLAAADAALYEAKRAGKNCVRPAVGRHDNDTGAAPR